MKNFISMYISSSLFINSKKIKDTTLAMISLPGPRFTIHESGVFFSLKGLLCSIWGYGSFATNPSIPLYFMKLINKDSKDRIRFRLRNGNVKKFM